MTRIDCGVDQLTILRMIKYVPQDLEINIQTSSKQSIAE